MESPVSSAYKNGFLVQCNQDLASFLRSEIHKKCALLEEALKLNIPVQFYKAKKVRTGAHLKFFSKKKILGLQKMQKNAKTQKT